MSRKAAMETFQFPLSLRVLQFQLIERFFMHACFTFDKASVRINFMCVPLSFSRTFSMKEVRLIVLRFFALSCVLQPDFRRTTTLALFQLLGM